MDTFFDWRWWLIEKYNTIWYKVSPDIKKEFDNEPVYNKHPWNSLINLDSTLDKDGDYYPQVFFKKMKIH